jgi:hypothetical protein
MGRAAHLAHKKRPQAPVQLCYTMGYWLSVARTGSTGCLVKPDVTASGFILQIPFSVCGAAP